MSDIGTIGVNVVARTEGLTTGLADAQVKVARFSDSVVTNSRTAESALSKIFTSRFTRMGVMNLAGAAGGGGLPSLIAGMSSLAMGIGKVIPGVGLLIAGLGGLGLIGKKVYDVMHKAGEQTDIAAGKISRAHSAVAEKMDKTAEAIAKANDERKAAAEKVTADVMAAAGPQQTITPEKQAQAAALSEAMYYGKIGAAEFLLAQERLGLTGLTFGPMDPKVTAAREAAFAASEAASEKAALAAEDARQRQAERDMAEAEGQRIEDESAQRLRAAEIDRQINGPFDPTDRATRETIAREVDLARTAFGGGQGLNGEQVVKDPAMLKKMDSLIDAVKNPAPPRAA